MTSIKNIIARQRNFFSQGKTKNVDFRLENLKKLWDTIKKHETEICDAAAKDLGKPAFEAWYSDVASVLLELKYIRKRLKSWTRPQRVSPPLYLVGSKSFIHPEPLGLVLIIGTWNYPFHTVFYPLVGVIAAGNCAVLKPSELSTHSSRTIAGIIKETFDPEHIACIEGGPETAQFLISLGFDHIFFTGGETGGKKVMESAAKHLTPVTLELGGKNPVVVEPDVPITHAARRIIWGKFINAGQTCLSPDYLLVNKNIKNELIAAMKNVLVEFYGDDPLDSPDYGRIINKKHFQRILNLLSCGNIVAGGKAIPEKLYISPTIISDVKPSDGIMQEEIFGPLLPVLEYEDLNYAISYINSKPKPLCMYIFTKRSDSRDNLLKNTSAGNVCINDTIFQTGVLSLPFGGVGKSGMGSYHGKYSFAAFTHHKSVLKRPYLIKNDFIHPPYEGKLKKLKRFLR
ncbi:MAG: aldehyde dehydrogenase family protein [Candidatus Aminicenantes bacterium]|nr:aldehyde dehydrogenase family protein [Candidatus Aminicenantes bacterium]